MILVFDRRYTTYGHFLVDILPRLLIAEQSWARHSPAARSSSRLTYRPGPSAPSPVGFGAVPEIEGRSRRLFLSSANGARKSTLLAIMAGVLPPTSGSVDRVLALLGSAAEGLDQEATGRDNIVSAFSSAKRPRPCGSGSTT